MRACGSCGRAYRIPCADDICSRATPYGFPIHVDCCVTRNILAKSNIEKLRATAAAGALLGFDYDGTLAPMSGDPFTNGMRPETVELLRSLASAAPVAVITGRSVQDVTTLLHGITFTAVIGNHGAEPSPFAKRAAKEVAAWMPVLQSAVARLPGVEIEDKKISVSVHYWNAKEPSAAVAAIDALVPSLSHTVEVVQGIGLVNIIPKGAPNKGDALKSLMKRHGFASGLFVGDELTDETAFRMLGAGRGLGIRVGPSKGTAAAYHIPSQLDMDALLTELLIGRTRPPRHRDQEASPTTRAQSAA